MTTWTLKLTPPEGPETEKTGLSREQALAALSDLMYGRTEDFVPAEAASPAERDQALPLAA
jgi:hypothetical protein